MDSKHATEHKETTDHADIELRIDTNQVNVSNRKNKSFYVFLGKKILEKHDTLVMNALGNATSISVMAADTLVRNGYAVYTKMETHTISVEQTRDDAAKGTVQRAKLILTLKKSKDFDENMRKFAEIREENEKLDAAEKK